MNLDEHTLCTTHLVKYPDCNATQNLFGGQLLAWLDESVAIYASKHMGTNLLVTAHFGGLDFKVPTELRKVVTIYAKVIKEGRTSLTVHGVATKRDMGSSEETFVADTEIVFVAVGEDMKPKPWH
jgi:acyl-CoA hydrolase